MSFNPVQAHSLDRDPEVMDRGHTVRECSLALHYGDSYRNTVTADYGGITVTVH